MIELPIISRLGFRDYGRLFLAISILGAEWMLRLMAFIFPMALLDRLRLKLGIGIGSLPRLFNGDRSLEDHKMCGRDPFEYIMEAPDLIRYHGYECEEHVVQTADGFFLVLHRILPSSKTDSTAAGLASTPQDNPRPISPPNSASNRGPPVLMLHGALSSSNMWLCNRPTRRNLSLHLVDEGFDVWLGNRRGNHYSHKHVTYSPSDNQFWNHSIDECVRHDLPATIEYILEHVRGYRRLSIVGFSQGNAEALAAVSIMPRLSRRINCIVALSASIKPLAPPSSLLSSMARWPPELVYLLFGRRAMLSSIFFWSRALNRRILGWLVEGLLYLLLGHRGRNVRSREKQHISPHLYSYTSVKQVLHWLQIIRAQRFQMFEDVVSKYGPRTPPYPLRTISLPTLIICGGRDGLVDFEFLEEQLPHAQLIRIPHYEHLDVFLATDADLRVFPQVATHLRNHTVPEAPTKPHRPRANTSVELALSNGSNTSWPSTILPR